MHLKDWLDSERGRYSALAIHLGVTLGRVSQIAREGVPKSYLLKVRDFTAGSVSIEEMLVGRDAPEPAEERTHG